MGTNENDVTTVKVKKETWKQLNKRKEPGDTFDDVISNLIEQSRQSGNQSPTATAD